MSETTATNIIRQAINTVSLEGYLKEMKLERGTTEKGDCVRGYIIIKTGEHSEHRVDAFSSAKTKDGKDSSSYKNLTKFMNEAVSVASLMKDGKTEEEAYAAATKVTARGASLRLNEYFDEHNNDTLLSEPRVNASYLTRVSEENFEPRAKFEIEGFIDKIRPEIKNEGETGRVYLDMIIPQYQGRVEPMTFVTTKEAGAYIIDNYEPHQTVALYGEIVNTVNRVVTRKAGFAGEEESVSATYVRELLVNNGTPADMIPDEDSPKAYKLVDIQNALKVRETEYLPQKLADQKKRSANKSAGGAGVGFAGSAATSGVAPSAGAFKF